MSENKENKTEGLNISEGLEGLSDEQRAELYGKLKKVVSETKTGFINAQKSRALEARYRQELDTMNLTGLTNEARIRKISTLKSKYRALGLEVY